MVTQERSATIIENFRVALVEAGVSRGTVATDKRLFEEIARYQCCGEAGNPFEVVTGSGQFLPEEIEHLKGLSAPNSEPHRREAHPTFEEAAADAAAAIDRVAYRNSRLNSIYNGVRFNDMFGEVVRWVEDAKCWYVYRREERRWVASGEDVREMGKAVVFQMIEDARLMAQAATNDEDRAHAEAYKKWAKQTADTHFEKMLRMASSEPRVRIRMADFDSEPWLLNTPAGSFDLRTGCVVANGRLVTKRTPVAPAEKWQGGLWQRFLEYVVPDPEVRAYLQRACGYAAYFGVEERLILFLLGETGCGKSKFVEAIYTALGDYAVAVSTEQFLMGNRDNYGLARLPGSRLIIASEFDEHAKINVALVKRITSGEPVTVRMAYGVPFDYKPGGTILISTNHAPFLGSDAAAWARTAFVPFNVPLEEANGLFGETDLSEQLQDAAGEVLAWVLEGARLYWETVPVKGSRLLRPQAVVEAGVEVRDDQKHYAVRFVEECFDGNREAYQDVDDLYALLKHWACREGISEKDLVPKNWLGRRLKAAGVLHQKAEKRRYWAVGRLRKDGPGLAAFFGSLQFEQELLGRLEAGCANPV